MVQLSHKSQKDEKTTKMPQIERTYKTSRAQRGPSLLYVLSGRNSILNELPRENNYFVGDPIAQDTRKNFCNRRCLMITGKLPGKDE